MHPALSVIIFTVSSGAGFGLMALICLIELAGGLPGLSQTATLTAIAIAVSLSTLGLVSSTLHLANPKNAWRAFFRFRSSWLSREGVLAVLSYPAMAIFTLGVWLNGGASAAWWSALAAVLTLILSLGLVFTTGMIYASLRTIPQWHNPLVPANYLLLALASGAVILTAVVSTSTASVELVGWIALTLVTLAAIAKGIYFYWIGKPQGPTINTAIGITRAKAKLLEAGQSSNTFLNKEFGFAPDASVITKLRIATFGAAFIMPIIMLLVLQVSGLRVLALLAVPLLIAGLMVERWLFFAEARHTVNLFYGRQQC
jgi:sulfite dehydrogenase (quinone) subunit SoeC